MGPVWHAKHGGFIDSSSYNLVNEAQTVGLLTTHAEVK